LKVKRQLRDLREIRPTPSDRRERLSGRLLDSAEKAIAEHGLAGLKARDVAADAGCALGAIYTVFEDLDELILRVGARTFALLGAALTPPTTVLDPAEELTALASSYLAFARDYQPRWRALFEHRLPPGRSPPDWFIEDRERLFALLEGPIAKLAPDTSPKARAALARTLFSAVHGVVSLGLEEKLAPADPVALEADLAGCVRMFAEGLRWTGGRP
jgi:AcrR family transcriptional regulator